MSRLSDLGGQASRAVDTDSGHGGRPWAAASAQVAAGALHVWLAATQVEHAQAHAIFFVAFGLVQILSGAALFIRPSNSLAWAGMAVNGGSIVLWAATRLLRAPFSPLPEELAATGVGTKTIELAAVVALGYLLEGPARPKMQNLVLTSLRAVAVASAAGALMLASGYALEPLFPALAGPDDSARAETPHVDAHAGGDGHQATFRVRLSGESAGPYRVDAFTGATEIGNLFIEVRVEDEAARPLGNLVIGVEARPAGSEGSPVSGIASPDLAEVPGDYAVSLPVPSAGFWDVAVTIGGPLGESSVAFSERIGGTANLAGWVLAGVPLAIAVLFGLVYIRTAGRRRG